MALPHRELVRNVGNKLYYSSLLTNCAINEEFEHSRNSIREQDFNNRRVTGHL